MGNTHTNPQVTIDHAEYQELLEAQKALEYLTKKMEKGEIGIVHQYTDYHSKNNYEKRDFYIVTTPDELTLKLIEHVSENSELLKEINTNLGNTYSVHGYRNLSEMLTAISKHVIPVPKK